jgi:hypothetical protein
MLSTPVTLPTAFDTMNNQIPSVDTLNFNGDGVTVLGFIGVISTLIIVVTAFRRYSKSPMRR